MGIECLITQEREAILRVAARHGAGNVRVIGSVARNEADESSDIDLLVTFEPGTTLMDHAALVTELEELLGCKVDVASDRVLRPRVRQRVLNEAVAL